MVIKLNGRNSYIPKTERAYPNKCYPHEIQVRKYDLKKLYNVFL